MICKMCGEEKERYAKEMCQLCYGREWRKNHPTVKPIKLMQYLCRLITPPKGIVLDPFAGSGTTGIACKLEGFDFILIEREPDYVEIIEVRVRDATPSKNKKIKNGHGSLPSPYLLPIQSTPPLTHLITACDILLPSGLVVI